MYFDMTVVRDKAELAKFIHKVANPRPCGSNHYVTIFFLLLTGYKLLMDNWVGYLIAGFALVYVANFYMSLFGLLRQGIVKEKAEIKIMESDLDETKKPAA